MTGLYSFSLLCSDDCQFRLRHDFDASITSSRNRLIYIGGPNAPREEEASVSLTAGSYDILISHGASVNDTGTDEDLRNNLGLACVLYWVAPQ